MAGDVRPWAVCPQHAALIEAYRTALQRWPSDSRFQSLVWQLLKDVQSRATMYNIESLCSKAPFLDELTHVRHVALKHFSRLSIRRERAIKCKLQPGKSTSWRREGLDLAHECFPGSSCTPGFLAHTSAHFRWRLDKNSEQHDGSQGAFDLVVALNKAEKASRGRLHL